MRALAREKWLTLPNVLTMLRVGSIPFLVLLLYLPGRGWAIASPCPGGSRAKRLLAAAGRNP